MPLGPWTSTKMDGIASGLLEARGEDVLIWLRDQGLNLPAGNRLRRAIDRIKFVNEDPLRLLSMSEVDAALLLEATRDVFDAFLVTWAAVERKRRVNVFPNSRLRALLSGSDTPAADPDPMSRNIQFEMVAGAHLVLGGADLVPEEPDYSMLYHGRRVGIAVKRLTSVLPAKVNDRLREAVKQIEGSFREGFAIVNLDGWITDLSGGTTEEVGRQFATQLQTAYPEIMKVARRKESLLGILIMGTWSRWQLIDGKRQLEWHTPLQLIGFNDTDEQERAFYEFMGPMQERRAKSMLELQLLIQRPAENRISESLGKSEDVNGNT